MLFAFLQGALAKSDYNVEDLFSGFITDIVKLVNNVIVTNCNSLLLYLLEHLGS